MKTGYHRFLVAFMLCLCVACNDESMLETTETAVIDHESNLVQQAHSELVPESITSETISELTNTLKEWGKELLIAAKNPKTKALIYAGIEKQFDGDHNVLIHSMMAANTNATLNEAKQRITLFNSQSNLKTITGEDFAIIDKETQNRYYPQIYVPSFEKVKSLNSDPILVIGLEEKETYTGYVLDIKGNLVKHDRIIDEAFSMDHEVWAITISENVDNNGEVLEDFLRVNGSEIANEEVTTNNSLPRVTARLTGFRLGDLNESWVGGRAELFMKRISLFDLDPRFPDVGDWNTYPVGDPTRGNLVRSITQNSANDYHYFVRFNYNVGWHPTLGNNTLAKGSVLAYVFYERDNWPARMRRVNIEIELGGCVANPNQIACGGPKRVVQLDYRSSNGHVDAGTIYYPYPFPSPYNPRNPCDFDLYNFGATPSSNFWWESSCFFL